MADAFCTEVISLRVATRFVACSRICRRILYAGFNESREFLARQSCELLGLKFEELTTDIVNQVEHDWDRTLSLIDEPGKGKILTPANALGLYWAPLRICTDG